MGLQQMSDAHAEVDKSNTLKSRYLTTTTTTTTNLNGNALTLNGFGTFPNGVGTFLAPACNVPFSMSGVNSFPVGVWTRVDTSQGFQYGTPALQNNIIVNDDNLEVIESGFYQPGFNATGSATVSSTVELGVGVNDAEPTIVASQVGLGITVFKQPITATVLFDLIPGDRIYLYARPSATTQLTFDTGNVIFVKFGESSL